MPATKPQLAAPRSRFHLKESAPFLSTVLAALAAFIALAATQPTVHADASPETPIIGVGSQYDSPHVYVPPADLDQFVNSFLATFGGTSSPSAVMTVTPTPSETVFRAVATPAGLLSTFAFKSPIPYPFGAERTGYLVTNMDDAIRAARANGADIVVGPFKDPIGM